MHHDVPREDVEVLEHHVVAVREHLRPALAARVVQRRRHQPEVAPPAAVGADPEALAGRVDTVIHVVLVVLLARPDHPPLAERLGGRQPAVLAGGERARRREDHLAAARPKDAEPEERVGLLEQEIVGGRPEPMAPQTVRTLGLVLGDVEEDGIVGAPGRRGHLLDAIREHGPRLEVLHVQRVVAKAGEVDGVREQPRVVAHRVDPEREEGVALRHPVEVERDLLRRARHVAPAAVDRVLLAGLRARVVDVGAAPVGDAGVVLLDAREHLLVEGVLERLRALHDGVGVRVLGLEIRRHLGTVLVAQPGIFVLAALAVDHVRLGHALRERGRRAHRAPIVPPDRVRAPPPVVRKC